MTGPKTLIVGDGVVKNLKSFCSKKNSKVLFSPMKWSLTLQKEFWTLC